MFSRRSLSISKKIVIIQFLPVDKERFSSFVAMDVNRICGSYTLGKEVIVLSNEKGIKKRGILRGEYTSARLANAELNRFKADEEESKVIFSIFFTYKKCFFSYHALH